MTQHAHALPRDAILLHIGPHKTGTTAIQGMLGGAREELAKHGVLYPGTRPHHHDEARVILAHPSGWANDKDPLPPSRVWDELVEAVRGADGRSVISSEFFGLCDDEGRARIVADLGADRLHVLVAARNPASIAVSTWQQVLRDGYPMTLTKWLEDRFRRPSPTHPNSNFWSWADAANQVEAWSRVLDVDRIRVLVIDESDRTLLPSAFEQLLDVPAGLLSAVTPGHSNRGLTAPEAELLRTAIALTKSTLTWRQYSAMFRSGYALRLVRSRTPAADEPRSTLPPWATEQALAEAEHCVERLRASGVPVIGRLENLLSIPPADGADPPDSVSMELAAEAIAGVVDGARRQIERLERDNARLRRRAARRVDDLGTRELATRLGRRVRAGIARRVRGGQAPERRR